MKIELKQIKIKDLIENFTDNGESGVFGYNGLLNIRPPYQREFIYDPKQQLAVIDSVMKGFPLNTMYWVKNDNGTFELLDGQQRTMSICKFVKGDISYSSNENECTLGFSNLCDDDRNKFLNYELMVYVCDGTDKEKLNWFKTINISGVKLTDQELLNINYVGSWLADAKGWFSKNNCQALSIGKDYVKGIAIRQELLELALEWICEYQGIKSIDIYMARHQHDANATELWLHFNKVIEWVKAIFPTYRKEMKGLDWGRLYFEYGNEMYDTNELEKQISTLMSDDDVTNKKGVYEYVLSRRTKERVLSVRTFSDRDKRTAYEKQNGICSICGEHFELNEMQADHIIEWSKGGKTTIDNLQMVCHKCHKELTRTLHD